MFDIYFITDIINILWILSGEGEYVCFFFFDFAIQITPKLKDKFPTLRGYCFMGYLK